MLFSVTFNDFLRTQKMTIFSSFFRHSEKWDFLKKNTFKHLKHAFYAWKSLLNVRPLFLIAFNIIHRFTWKVEKNRLFAHLSAPKIHIFGLQVEKLMREMGTLSGVQASRYPVTYLLERRELILSPPDFFTYRFLKKKNSPHLQINLFFFPKSLFFFS